MAFAKILGVATTVLVVFILNSVFISFKFAPSYAGTYHVVNFLVFVLGIMVGWNTTHNISDRTRGFVDGMSFSAFLLGVGSFFYKFSTMFNV
jgi:hypothetical protein